MEENGSGLSLAIISTVVLGYDATPSFCAWRREIFRPFVPIILFREHGIQALLLSYVSIAMHRFSEYLARHDDDRLGFLLI